MANAKHSDQTVADGNHIISRWSHANATARASESVVAADVGGVSHQTDNDTFWVLRSVGPAVWGQVAGGGEANTASNVGLGADIFKQKTGVNLEFRGVAGTGGVVDSVNGDNVELSGAALLARDGSNGAMTADLDVGNQNLINIAWNTISPAAIAAQADNYNPTGFADADSVRVTLTGDQTITGFVHGNVDRVVLFNIDGTDSLTLAHESASSTAANRIACPNGANYVMEPNSAVLMERDATSSRWRVVAVTKGGTDADAIHDNVAGEIAAVALKASPVSGDLLLIEDSADSNNKKRVTAGSLPGGTDADAIHDNVAGEIAAVTEKTTPVSADLLLIEDSAASNAKKRVQVGNLPGGGGGANAGQELLFEWNGSDLTQFESGSAFVSSGLTETLTVVADSDLPGGNKLRLAASYSFGTTGAVVWLASAALSFTGTMRYLRFEYEIDDDSDFSKGMGGIAYCADDSDAGGLHSLMAVDGGADSLLPGRKLRVDQGSLVTVTPDFVPPDDVMFPNPYHPQSAFVQYWTRMEKPASARPRGLVHGMAIQKDGVGYRTHKTDNTPAFPSSWNSLDCDRWGLCAYAFDSATNDLSIDFHAVRVYGIR